VVHFLRNFVRAVLFETDISLGLSQAGGRCLEGFKNLSGFFAGRFNKEGGNYYPGPLFLQWSCDCGGGIIRRNWQHCATGSEVWTIHH
jgi:hypothetical protein